MGYGYMYDGSDDDLERFIEDQYDSASVKDLAEDLYDARRTARGLYEALYDADIAADVPSWVYL